MNAKVAVLAVLFLLVPSVPVKAKKIPPRPFFLQTPVTMNGAEIPEGLYESGKSQLSVRIPKDPAARFPAVVRAADVLLAVTTEAAETVSPVVILGAAA